MATRRARGPLRLQRPIDQRRREVEDARSMGVKLHRVSIRQSFRLTSEFSEGLTDVNFPVQFIEEPVFFFGMVLNAGVAVTVGSLPTASAVVVEWETTPARPDGEYYVGARLALYATGDEGQLGKFHLHFEGKAMRNPVASEEGEG